MERLKQRLKQCMEWTPSTLSAHASPTPFIGCKSLPSFGEAADHHLTLPAPSGGTNHRIPQPQ